MTLWCAEHSTSWRSRGLPARLVQEWHGEVSWAAATVLRQWRIHYWLGIQGMVAGTLKKWRTINGGRVVVVVGRCWYNNPLQWASFVLYNTSTPWVVQSLLLLQPSCDRQAQSDWLTDWLTDRKLHYINNNNDLPPLIVMHNQNVLSRWKIKYMCRGAHPVGGWWVTTIHSENS